MLRTDRHAIYGNDNVCILISDLLNCKWLLKQPRSQKPRPKSHLQMFARNCERRKGSNAIRYSQEVIPHTGDKWV